MDTILHIATISDSIGGLGGFYFFVGVVFAIPALAILATHAIVAKLLG